MTYLTSQTPQFHGLVPAAAHETVLVVQYVQAPYAVCVSAEGLQLYLLYVEYRVFIRPADLVFPVRQPIAAQLSAGGRRTDRLAARGDARRVRRRLRSGVVLLYLESVSNHRYISETAGTLVDRLHVVRHVFAIREGQRAVLVRIFDNKKRD